MRSETITVTTGAAPGVFNLTRACARFVQKQADGLLNVFVPHATAGLAIIETGAGSDDDLLRAIDQLLPTTLSWTHAHGSRGHGRDHVWPAFFAPSLIIPVQDGRMLLGTWQSVCLVDTNIDNPERSVRLSFLAG